MDTPGRVETESRLHTPKNSPFGNRFQECKGSAWYVRGVAREQGSKEERLFDGNQAIQAD